MSRVILANLGFEYELAGRPQAPAVRAQEQRFASILRLVPGWRDAEVFDAKIGITDELLVWGMSNRARSAAGVAAGSWPTHEAVYTANDKTFSHEVERRLGVDLPGSRVVESLDELAEAVANLPDWTAKHPFGVAGREQVRGQQWSENIAQRAASLFSTTSRVVVEPWVTVDAEFSMHFDIRPTGIDRIGATGLHTDRGTFRGNRTGGELDDTFWRAGSVAAHEVRALGYVGPLGIDAFSGTLNGDPVSRPVVELNARWTFGRLALELAEQLGRHVIWHHPVRSGRPAGLVSVPGDGGVGRWLLPHWSDPDGASGCWIEVLGESL